MVRPRTVFEPRFHLYVVRVAPAKEVQLSFVPTIGKPPSFAVFAAGGTLRATESAVSAPMPFAEVNRHRRRWPASASTGL